MKTIALILIMAAAAAGDGREDVVRKLETMKITVEKFKDKLFIVLPKEAIADLNWEHGDILADVASGSIGGLGLSPSACYGERYAYFEPVHGSAPDLAGKGIINPTAMLLSGAMMLTYLGYTEQGKHLERAIEQIYRAGVGLTRDQGGTGDTMKFVEAVVESIVSMK